MFKRTFLLALTVLILGGVPSAHAGKMELTTYYPAPYGEYAELQASTKLQVPVVAKNTKTTANTTVGEIWVEPV
jgi:hypothetical protein